MSALLSDNEMMQSLSQEDDIKFDKFHHLDLQYLKTLVNENKVSTNIADKLLNYWEMRLSEPRDPMYKNYFEYFLFFEAVNSGIISVFIYDQEYFKIKHQYGILASSAVEIIDQFHLNHPDKSQILPEISEHIYKNKTDVFNLSLRSIVFENTRYIIGVISPQDTDISNSLRRLVSVFKRFYLPDIFNPDLRPLKLFSEMNKEILKNINLVLRKKQPVTFTYFKFERFQKFVDLAGEHFAIDVVNGLVKELTGRLKTQDQCFVLNPREYLIISMNCEKEILEKRYYKILFQIKSLLIYHQVKYTTWHDEINNFADIWHDLSYLEPRRRR